MPINPILSPLVVTEDALDRLSAVLGELASKSGARAACLVEQSGQMLASAGQVAGLDTMAIASLTASAFASSRAVAKLLGESGFSGMYQQGEQASLAMLALETGDVLVVVFSDPAKTGLVKVHAEAAAPGITAALRALEKASR